jgi:hypothetical protein
MSDAHSVNIKVFLTLIIVMSIVIFPRFDRLDRFGIDAYTTNGKPAAQALADAGAYINHVRYFRGEVDETMLRAPWAYRPLPTFLASLLPLNAMTSINVVNFIFLSLGLFFLLKTLGFMRLNPKIITLGGFAYVISFPVFFYGAVGYIDPVLVGMLGIGQYLTLNNQNKSFFALLILGALVKDPYIIILPAWLVYQYGNPEHSLLKVIAISVIAMLVFVSLIYFVRQVTPVDSGFFWHPNQEYLDFNLYRKNAWITSLITLVPIGVFAFWFCLRENFSLIEERALASLTVGFCGAIAVLIYSFFSVYVDGRYIWIAYPFMIPLACKYLDDGLKKRFPSMVNN